ncbi:hypothetical protein [Aureivirga sp. CE67]|uniref:hypothetical protein n=1 Tax=Aureivirga sp. CE67 TaxID=1788983 RepID=UPI0018C98415|nr:hypothetical protein [Aureivirga sp. CE67]
MKKTLLIIFLLLFSLKSFSCVCIVEEISEGIYNNHELIFSGEILEVEECNRFGEQEYLIKVLERYKGNIGEKYIATNICGSSCSLLVKEENKLLFIVNSPFGEISQSICASYSYTYFTKNSTNEENQSFLEWHQENIDFLESKQNNEIQVSSFGLYFGKVLWWVYLFLALVLYVLFLRFLIKKKYYKTFIILSFSVLMSLAFYFLQWYFYGKANFYETTSGQGRSNLAVTFLPLIILNILLWKWKKTNFLEVLFVNFLVLTLFPLLNFLMHLSLYFIFEKYLGFNDEILWKFSNIMEMDYYFYFEIVFLTVSFVIALLISLLKYFIRRKKNF